MKALPYILIVIALLVAGGIYLEKHKGAKPLVGFDNKNEAMSKVQLKDYGAAPEITGISKWLNSEPLTMQGLRGKVVLIDFWTYSCINCIRTLPYVTGWYEKYKDDGFVVVGVHTPEFAFEKDTNNVQTALKRHSINYPVAQDNDFGTWNAYDNRYWPAHYLIDKNGRIVYTHFGEGKYQETENAIQELLGLHEDTTQVDEEKRNVQTPEIYFGLERLQYLDKSQKAVEQTSTYRLPTEVAPNNFALEGSWSFDGERAKLDQGPGRIKLNFYAKDVHMVAKANKPVLVEVKIGSQTIQTIQVTDSSLYTLYQFGQSGYHELELYINDPGFEIFTFTFG